MCLKFPLSTYTMLRSHNIAWRNFCSLFLNIVKRGKGVETQNCLNSSFSCNFVTDCLKKYEKLSVVFYNCSLYIKLKARNYPLRHNFAMVSHYLHNGNIKALFEMIKKPFGMVRFNKSFLLGQNFARFSHW